MNRTGVGIAKYHFGAIKYVNKNKIVEWANRKKTIIVTSGINTRTVTIMPIAATSKTTWLMRSCVPPKSELTFFSNLESRKIIATAIRKRTDGSKTSSIMSIHLLSVRNLFCGCSRGRTHGEEKRNGDQTETSSPTLRALLLRNQT